MFYNKYIPQDLNNYNNSLLIDDIKKINKNTLNNFIFYGKIGYGKTTIKDIILKQFKNDKKINLIELNLNEDFNKNKNNKEKLFFNIKKINTKIFIIDHIMSLTIEQQYFIKSLLKSYKNIYFFIFLNNITNLIENFYSFFIIYKIDNKFYEINKIKYLNNFLENEKINITNNKYNYIIENSTNFYILNKFILYIYFYKNDYLKYFNEDIKICNNKNKEILNNILNNNLINNIKYIDKLLDNGLSINNIINYIINSIVEIDINFTIKENIIKILLDNELYIINNNYSYIRLIYIIKKITEINNK